MRSFCIVFLVLISVSYVLSQTVTLEQPGSTVVKPSQTLKTTCKVSVSVTIHTWHWARQKTGSGLEYIGYITGSGGINYASTFQGKVTFTRETSKNELYFEMSNMRNEDSGIYYCVKQDAHSDNRKSGLVIKTHNKTEIRDGKINSAL
uniref:Ig-like domain-containing protein n=1 Tax=Leptobrachium leishanense TaxID=445787 RepID=A0A8C5MBL3_9ANUR